MTSRKRVLNMKHGKIQNKRKLKKPFKIFLVGLFSIIILLLVCLIFFPVKNTFLINDTLNITKEITPEKTDEIKEKLLSLKNANKDFVGILTIPNTILNYPVMYTKGEDYYLRRDFNKLPSTAGTLYIDKHNEISPRDENLIIYGHNMNDGTMFHEILNYKDYTYYLEHKNIYFYTENNYETYEIVAAFLSKVYYKTDNVIKYYQFYNAKNTIEFQYYVDNIKDLSLYDTGVIPTYKDEFITLSTCEYSQENGRFVVVARKIY